jgi:mRNA-degrading endonuclease RelE of RelBE toxin-antitoxin system
MIKKIDISYSKSSKKFLAKNQHIITINETDTLIIKAIKSIFYQKVENIDVLKMVGYTPNHYRIRTGKIRIVFTVLDGVISVVDVVDIDFRGNIYK